jgi:hypothetical protein
MAAEGGWRGGGREEGEGGGGGRKQGRKERRGSLTQGKGDDVLVVRSV